MWKIYLLSAVWWAATGAAVLAQGISGKIISTTGERVENAQVLLKDSANTLQIREFALATGGAYQILPKQSYRRVVIEVRSLGYRKAHALIDPYEPTQTYTRDFVLEVETINLHEVVVRAQKKYEQQSDTTSFRVQAYRDGTERKIEDLIKKLPNIEVDERTGKIKYKGKPIKTVKLDGDNLFDDNYAIGTRNIDVEQVEQVQVLDNYSQNPLLKGIEHSDEAALNLVLKKMPTQYSGNVEGAIGAFIQNPPRIAADASATLLGISNRYKSFVTLSYNNVGTNKTPYNYASYAINADNILNPTQYAPLYIPDTYFNISTIPLSRNTFNNTLFGSYNGLFKVHRKFTIRFNLLYLHDRISSEQFAQNDLHFNNERFTTTDQYTIRKIPQRYVGKLEMRYALAQNALLEYNTNYEIERINTTTDVLQNNSTNYHTQLRTRTALWRQILTYTYRLSKSKAFQLIATHTLHRTPQDFSLLPAVYLPQTYLSNHQATRFEKNYLELKAQLLSTQKDEKIPSQNRDKYSLVMAGVYYATDFATGLQGNLGQENQAISPFANQGRYQRYWAYTSGSYRWVMSPWTILASLRVGALKQHLYDYLTARGYTADNVIVEPSLSLRYRIGRISSVSASAAYKQQPFGEDYFVPNPVYISNRQQRANEISLALQQQQTYTMGYRLGDLTTDYRFAIQGIYTQNRGNYFNRLDITLNSTSTVAFFLPESTHDRTVVVELERYAHAIKSSFRWRSNYNIADYKNTLDALTLRNNQRTSWRNELFFKTAFDSKFNFENLVQYDILRSSTENRASFTNRSLSNALKIIAKPSTNIVLLLSQQMFLPNLQQAENIYYFADISCRMSAKKFSWELYLRNITNTQTFRQFSVNDFSAYLNQINLLPRHLLGSMYVSF